MKKKFKKNSGFTLLELMITVFVISILGAIAYPSYQDYARKARRVDAKNALMDFSSRQERFYSINNKYSTDAKNLGYSGSFPLKIISGGTISFYELSFDTKNNGKNWVATAKPINVQASDKCGSFTIDDKGRRANTGVGANRSDCW